MKSQWGKYKQASRKVIEILKVIGSNVKWPTVSALLFCTNNMFGGVASIDKMVDRVVLIAIALVIYLLSLAVIYGIKLGFWNDYLSKIRWPKKPLDCEHDEDLTLLFLVTLAVILSVTLIPSIFQVGIDLALITVLAAYIYYRMKYSSWRCVVSIIVYSLVIIGLLYHVYEIFRQIWC